MGARGDLLPRLARRRPRRRAGRARRLPRARRARRERAPRPRPGRRDPRLLQRVPPPGHRGGGTGLRHVPSASSAPITPGSTTSTAGSSGPSTPRTSRTSPSRATASRPSAPRPGRASCSCASPTRRVTPRAARPTWATGTSTTRASAATWATLQRAARLTYDVGANWKIVAENYSECYHCPAVHPLLNQRTPYDLGEDFLAEGPWKGGWMPFAEGCETMSMSGFRDGRPLIYARDETEARRIYYYILWPNLIISVHPDYVLTHQAWPDGPNRSIVNCDLYVEARQDRRARHQRRDRVLGHHQPRGLPRGRGAAAGDPIRAAGSPAATRTRRRRSTRSTSWSRTAT